MNCTTPGLPVHHQLPECTQTHVHWVSDAIQPFYPLSSHAPPALNLSQHQGLFKWVSSSHQGGQSVGVSASTSVLPMNTQDWSPLGWTGWISLQSKGLSRVFSNYTQNDHSINIYMTREKNGGSKNQSFDCGYKVFFKVWSSLCCFILVWRQAIAKYKSENSGTMKPPGFPSGSMAKNLPAAQEMQIQSLGKEDPLEKEMATHPSILAWETPWTDQPGGL